MTENQYERAVWIKERIKEIDGLLDFLKILSDTDSGPSGNKAVLKQIVCETNERPKSIIIRQIFIDTWIIALRKEKEQLEGEFGRV